MSSTFDSIDIADQHGRDQGNGDGKAEKVVLMVLLDMVQIRTLSLIAIVKSPLVDTVKVFYRSSCTP